MEADDVVIDLNDHEIAMSPALYYQQRFFSCIALKSVAFALNQGPGMFGHDPVFANNVLIKDGVIGLSSHHGIHGHYNRMVIIENVHVRHFETHGIEMSYFHDLTMKNVEIGPSSTIAYLKGEYAYARWTVQALERIQNYGDFNDVFPVTFSGREEALEFDDVIENLRTLMDIAFKSVMGIEEYADDDADYLMARDLFINEDGIPYGAVMYGLFLNLWISNVFMIHPSVKHAQNATISNLNIHGLKHKTMEYVISHSAAWSVSDCLTAKDIFEWTFRRRRFIGISLMPRWMPRFFSAIRCWAEMTVFRGARWNTKGLR